MKTHAIRLLPGEDLKKQIIQICSEKKIKAACVLSSVGSLQQLKIRLANSKEFLEKKEKFEVLSLNGTVSDEGVHLHLAVSDSSGQVWGGHLADGNVVYTTCELVLGELDDTVFSREYDARTGFKELKII